MYCKKCGKEIAEGKAFCQYCGEPAGTGTGSALPAASFGIAPQEKKKKHRMPFAIIALLFAAGIGAALFLAKDGSRYKKIMKQVKQYLEEGDYEEALAGCEEAIELKEAYAEAYLISADIYMEEEAYGDAVRILQRGRKAVEDKFEDEVDEKLEEVYQAQAKALAGMWKLDYNLANLIPEEYGGGLFLELNAEIPIVLEITEDGIMNFSVEKEYFAGAQGWLSSAANGIATIYAKNPIAGKLAGKLADMLTGLLIDNIGVVYVYEVEEGNLHCVWQGEGAGEEIYAFEINGSTLTFLEEQTPGADTYYLKFPLTLERIY